MFFKPVQRGRVRKFTDLPTLDCLFFQTLTKSYDRDFHVQNTEFLKGEVSWSEISISGVDNQIELCDFQ